MSKTRSVYVCQACGAHFPRWSGQCSSCGQWNSLEETIEAPNRAAPSARAASLAPRKLAHLEVREAPRLQTGTGEWDRALGGGIVPGSVVLVGGDPGIGKSTLLLQIADAIASGARGRQQESGGSPPPDSRSPVSVLYVSGEESLPQIGLRARRLGLDPEGMSLAAETDLQAITQYLASERPALAVVDSIQSIYDPALDSPPGSVTQLRECTLRLHQVAKAHSIAILLVGHVTKEGGLAGPKVLEHMVDAVLYLEGERLQAYRLLRSVKNRFGPTNEVGVFEMRDGGLAEVENPSAAFLADRVGKASGSSTVVILEGTRPMLAEVQALVTRSALAMPRRMASGIDHNRVALLLAVLSKRVGIAFHDFDVHVNVVAGLHIEETAADLGTALAILSSHRDVPMDSSLVAIGEIGLGGELRSVGQMELRLREASKLGFRQAILPRPATGQLRRPSGMELLYATSVREAALRAGVQ